MSAWSAVVSDAPVHHVLSSSNTGVAPSRPSDEASIAPGPPPPDPPTPVLSPPPDGPPAGEADFPPQPVAPAAAKSTAIIPRKVRTRIVELNDNNPSASTADVGDSRQRDRYIPNED